MAFTQEELQRYARHFAVERIGLSGQEKLKASSVLLIGAGGIGSPAAFYLAAAGMGHLGILDDDCVDLSNLQRQILYKTSDLGKSKADTALSHLTLQNPHIKISSHPIRLTPLNAHSIFKNYDLVIDGSDNYPTRYLTNDVCAELKIPLISASIFQFSGQIAVFNFKNNLSNTQACYRCLYPAPPPPELIPNCAMAGVLGVVPGILATMAVSEAFKIILNFPESKSQLILYDTLIPKLDTYLLETNPDCPICSHHQKFSELNRFDQTSFKTCDLNNLNSHNPIPITIEQLSQWLSKNKENKENKNFQLLDVRENWERDISYIKPSIHIPLNNFLEFLTAESSQLSALDKNQPLVIYCKSGGRSQRAGVSSIQAGFTQVYNLTGGMIAWENQN